MRRIPRLTNAFSRQMENLERAVVAPLSCTANYVRRHQTIKTTPAFRPGVADRVGTLRDVAEPVERYEMALLAA